MSKIKITQDQYKDAEDKSAAAREFLEDDRFAFIRQLLTNPRDYAKDSILNNAIKEVSEVHPISDKITRILKTPKKVQVDELIGQYKLVNKFFADVQYYTTEKEELDKAISSKTVLVQE